MARLCSTHSTKTASKGADHPRSVRRRSSKSPRLSTARQARLRYAGGSSLRARHDSTPWHALAGPDQKHELRRQSARDPSKRPKLGCAQCASGEDVTDHHCHASVADLTRRVADFEARLNREPFVIADRLWVKDQLDPKEEKLRFSK